MLPLKNIKWLPVLMALTIMGITAFQIYWLQKTYEREARTLEIRSNSSFRDAVFSLQASKLKLDKIIADSNEAGSPGTNIERDKQLLRSIPRKKVSRLVNILIEKVKNPTSKALVLTDRPGRDTLHFLGKNTFWRRDRIMQFLYDVDSLQDSIKINEIDTAFIRRLHEQSMDVPFTIQRVKINYNDEPSHNEATIGFSHPITYKLFLGNTFPYLIRRILAVILLSIFLIAFSILSFALLYNNLLKQRRLADIKNEFISNITHELKTPIATVSVAIEALRSFNANMDAQKSKEYLDISANELQRLSLLVDKVLKLSMFENREIELKYELLDMKELVSEVTSSMRLQFEKYHAIVTILSEGDTTLQGDRLHIVSVLFNLLDNALKYSKGVPDITIKITGTSNKIHLCISDSGIGIPAAYKDKVFEKFFRVPTGNVHNAKGYGLGLSYVAHVIKRHCGNIDVESVEGDGSKFMIMLPKHSA